MKFTIPTPPWTGIGKKLESITRKAIYDFHLFDNITKIAIALSGGKDSLALLFLLKNIIGHGFPEIPLHAIHITGTKTGPTTIHREYLQYICEQLQIPLTIKETDHQPTSCYSCARHRRSILFEETKKVSASTIAFGHHRDDNVQTLLMNLLHKGEFAGILPKIHMHKYSTTIIRPIILAPEKDIITFAKQYQFDTITCQCPRGNTAMRKQTDKLIADIELLYPHARDNIARAIHLYGSPKAGFEVKMKK